MEEMNQPIPQGRSGAERMNSALRRGALSLAGVSLMVSVASAQFSAPENEVNLVAVEGQEPYALCYRDTATASIDSAVDTDVFIFLGRAGDVVQLSLRSPTGLDPRVDILDSLGIPIVDPLGNDPPYSCGNACSIFQVFTLAKSGIFTILVRDSDSNEGGSYELGLERLLPEQPVPSTDYGLTATMVINRAVDHDFVSFQGEAGTLVSLALNSANGLDPRINIWAPDGSLFETRTCANNCSISIPSMVLPQDGTYLIEVHDSNHDEGGTVTVSLTCLLANCPPPREDVNFGSIYCSSNANSTGNPVTLTARGSTDPADNFFTLEATDGPAGKLGIFFFGTNATATPFGQGIKCIANPVKRLSLKMLCSNGDAHIALDLNGLPGGTIFAPGSTWLFQYWYRDRNPTPVSNMSDGLTVTF